MTKNYLRSLGFKPDEEFTKQGVAKIQLERSIEHFLNGEFIVSLTLSGASDGILAGLVEVAGMEPSHETSFRLLKTFRKVLELDPDIDQASKADIFKAWNFGRNSLKHHDKRNEAVLIMNDCDEAFWMIRRAIRNAKILDIEISKVAEFERWVESNSTL